MVGESGKRHNAKGHHEPKYQDPPRRPSLPRRERAVHAVGMDAHHEVEVAQRVQRQQDWQAGADGQIAARHSLFVRRRRRWFRIVALQTWRLGERTWTVHWMRKRTIPTTFEAFHPSMTTRWGDGIRHDCNGGRGHPIFGGIFDDGQLCVFVDRIIEGIRDVQLITSAVSQIATVVSSLALVGFCRSLVAGRCQRMLLHGCLPSVRRRGDRKRIELLGPAEPDAGAMPVKSVAACVSQLGPMIDDTCPVLLLLSRADLGAKLLSSVCSLGGEFLLRRYGFLIGTGGASRAAESWSVSA